MTKTSSATRTIDKAEPAVYKVTNRSGWEVAPGSMTMTFLANGDNQPEIPRDRFIITKVADSAATAGPEFAGLSLLDVACRVRAENAAGNTEFRAGDAYQVAGGSVREITRDGLHVGGL